MKYTIRPAGSTSWASTTSRKKAIKLRKEAVDMGLSRVMIIDEDGNDVTSELIEASY